MEAEILSSIRNLLDHFSVSAWRRNFVSIFVPVLLLDWDEVLAAVRIVPRAFVMDSYSSFWVNWTSI